MIPFKPVVESKVEGAFLPDNPRQIIKSRQHSDVPFLTGLTAQDGAIKASCKLIMIV